MKTKRIDPRSPLGRLLIEKREIRRLCRIKEQDLTDDWSYIRDNGGRLLVTELASVFFRTHRSDNHRNIGNGAMPGIRELANIAWQFVRPLVFRWAALAGWRIIRSMFVKKRE